MVDPIPPSDFELTELIQKKADRERLPGESWAKAFARIFSANDDDGIALRRAIAIAKAAPFAWLEPHVDKQAVVGSGSAYDALMAKAAQLRQRDPTLSREQSFAKVYADPDNSELSQRERAESRPTAGW
jgi:hypothetical protein